MSIILLNAGILDLDIIQGVSYELILQLRYENGAYIDLTGYKGKSEIRAKTSGSLVATFNILFSALQNEIILSLAHQTTAKIASGNYAWDLFLEDVAGVRNRYVWGTVRVAGSVTQWI